MVDRAPMVLKHILWTNPNSSPQKPQPLHINCSCVEDCLIALSSADMLRLRLLNICQEAWYNSQCNTQDTNQKGKSVAASPAVRSQSCQAVQWLPSRWHTCYSRFRDRTSGTCQTLINCQRSTQNWDDEHKHSPATNCQKHGVRSFEVARCGEPPSYVSRSCAKLGLKRTLLSNGPKIHSQGPVVSNFLRQKGRNKLIGDDLGPALWGYGFKKTQWGSSLSRNLSWIDILIAPRPLRHVEPPS